MKKVFCFIFAFSGFLIVSYGKNAIKRVETCIDKFCPPGTFCATLNVVQCVKDPCKPLLACLPLDVNGCANHHCPKDMICVEHSTRCIGRSCKKVPKCATPGTCAALICPPSHKCQANPKPKCVKTIFTESDISELDHAAEE